MSTTQRELVFRAKESAWFDLMFLVSGGIAGLERRKLWPNVVRSMQMAADNPEAQALFDFISSKVIPDRPVR